VPLILLLVTVARAGEPAGNVAVLLERDGAAPRTPAEVRVDAVELSFVPKMQLAAPGSTLLVRNRDDETHSAHGGRARHTIFNHATVPLGREARLPLDAPGLTTLTCDLHTYMRAWVVVTRIPYGAVTGRDGRAQVEAPPGRYRVRLVAPDRDHAVAGAEPGEIVTEVSIASADQTLALALPARQVEPVRAPVVRAPLPPPRSPPAWFYPKPARWPTSTAGALTASAIAIALGFLLAIGNLRLARRMRWSLGAAVVIGTLLAGAAGLLFIFGLDAAVATALGFGLFAGTAIFSATWR
jgi:plastocyanin